MIKNKNNIFLHLEIFYQKVQNLPYIKANRIHIDKSYKKIKMKHKIYPKKKNNIQETKKNKVSELLCPLGLEILSCCVNLFKT